MLAATATHEELLVAIIGGLALVLAATIGIWSGQRKTKAYARSTDQALEAMNGDLKEEMALLVDASRQHSQRLDHIADRTDDATEKLTLLRATAQQAIEVAGEVGVKAVEIEERLVAVDERIGTVEVQLNEHLKISEPFIRYVASRMQDEQKGGKS